MDGTASLANRDFGRILSLNRRKLLSPVPCAIQNKPHTRAISPIREVNLQRRDSVADDAVCSEALSQKPEFPAIREKYREFGVFEADPGDGSAQSLLGHCAF
jgi:hypothetical protein